MTTQNTTATNVPALESARVVVDHRGGRYVVKAPRREGFALRMRAFGCPHSYDATTDTYVVFEAYRAQLWCAIAHSYRGLTLVSAKGARVI